VHPYRLKTTLLIAIRTPPDETSLLGVQAGLAPHQLLSINRADLAETEPTRVGHPGRPNGPKVTMRLIP